MARKVNKEVIKALEEKFYHPERDVICPVCHTIIEYNETEKGSYAGCKGCRVYGGLRGF